MLPREYIEIHFYWRTGGIGVWVASTALTFNLRASCTGVRVAAWGAALWTVLRSFWVFFGGFNRWRKVDGKGNGKGGEFCWLLVRSI